MNAPLSVELTERDLQRRLMTREGERALDEHRRDGLACVCSTCKALREIIGRMKQ